MKGLEAPPGSKPGMEVCESPWTHVWTQVQDVSDDRRQAVMAECLAASVPLVGCALPRHLRRDATLPIKTPDEILVFTPDGEVRGERMALQLMWIAGCSEAG